MPYGRYVAVASMVYPNPTTYADALLHEKLLTLGPPAPPSLVVWLFCAVTLPTVTSVTESSVLPPREETETYGGGGARADAGHTGGSVKGTHCAEAAAAQSSSAAARARSIDGAGRREAMKTARTKACVETARKALACVVFARKQ